MLVTFTTEAYADITMFGDLALSMLKMMGHRPTVPGAILAEDIPAALAKLTAAIKIQADAPVADEDVDYSEDDEPPVSMAHRALPLMELLRAAAEAKVNVMWDSDTPII